MDNELHFVNQEEDIEEPKPPVEVAGVPYVDENGVEHDDLVLYRGDNGCMIMCDRDGELYVDAVVRADSGVRFFETDEPIVLAEEDAPAEGEGDDDNADG